MLLMYISYIDVLYIVYIDIVLNFYMQRSLSFSRDVPGFSSVASKYRMPSTPKQPCALRRSSKSKIAKPQLPQNWVELVDEASLEKYSKEEIQRQEVSYMYM